MLLKLFLTYMSMVKKLLLVVILKCKHSISYYQRLNKMTTMATGKNLYGFSLTDNVGLITAYANDTNYENALWTVRVIMDKGDCLVN